MDSGRLRMAEAARVALMGYRGADHRLAMSAAQICRHEEY